MSEAHVLAVENNFEPWVDWSHYHNYTEIAATLQYLNDTYPTCVDVFSIGRSWGDRDIYCIRLTNESNINLKPEVFFVGYHHARELISAELPLFFAVDAASSFGVNATLTYLLNNSEVYIIPALNPDAYEAVEENEWQRKNVRPFDEDGDGQLDEDPPDDEDGDGYIEALVSSGGFVRWEGVDDDLDGLLNEDWVGGVDLNRNYGHRWDASTQSGSPIPGEEDYRGPSPFSELETQALRDFVCRHDFKYAVSFHSGTELIIYPWGYTNAHTADNLLLRDAAEDLSILVDAPYGQSGGGFYTSSGLWSDWMYGNQSILSFTCEIFGNNSAWQYEAGTAPYTLWERGVFEFFNPAPKDIENVIRRWLPVFTYITNQTITIYRDIEVPLATLTKTLIGEGFETNVGVAVHNKGVSKETFNLTVYANDTAFSSQLATLNSGEHATLTFVWNTAGWLKGHYEITTEAALLRGETSVLDNTIAVGTVLVTVPGDVTGDGRCSSEDISNLLARYGCEKSHPCYVLNFDFDGDDKIDLKEIFTAILHYELSP